MHLQEEASDLRVIYWNFPLLGSSFIITDHEFRHLLLFFIIILMLLH